MMQGPANAQSQNQYDPGFDMRLKYYESLGKLFEVISFAGAMNDFTQKIYCVNTVLDLVSPYINQDVVQNLDLELKEISRLNHKVLTARSNKDRSVQQQVLKDEQETRERISKALRQLLKEMAVKRMLLPTRAVDDDKSDDELAQDMGL